MSCGVVSAFGVLLIIHGFRHDRPIIDEETWSNNGTPKDDVVDDVTEEQVEDDAESLTVFEEMSDDSIFDE